MFECHLMRCSLIDLSTILQDPAISYYLSAPNFIRPSIRYDAIFFRVSLGINEVKLINLVLQYIVEA